MIIESKFALDKDTNQEILPIDRDADGFLYVCQHGTLRHLLSPGYPWHWHKAFEIDYVSEGELELKTTDGRSRIRKGEAFFVNSNVLHDIQICDDAEQCELYAHIFSPGFLSGSNHNILEQKYLTPILKSQGLQSYVIHADHYESFRMLEKIANMIELNRQEEFGFEFKLRAELSDIWCLLLGETENLRAQDVDINIRDSERLKVMLQFIHDHYMEKISLEQIAASANISTRECSRCFKRSISVSPVNYLNEYRIRMAADMLIYSGESALNISENCGFSSSSYMGKVFYETMHCTPKEYRKKFHSAQN